MKENEKLNNNSKAAEPENVEQQVEDQLAADQPSNSESKTEDLEAAEELNEVEKLAAELQEAKDKHLRLYSEFENFRRRTAKERLELISTANADLISGLLPVIDDFERALKLAEESDNSADVQGMNLIYQKLIKELQQKGLKPMEGLEGQPFDSELHEAISQIPAPNKKLKNCIVDVIEKGYYLNDKVIRYAKVVIGT